MHVILGIAGLAASVVLAWFAYLNIRQASLLCKPLRLDQLPGRVGSTVCVFGRPEPVEEVYLREAGSVRVQVLWMRITHQEREGSGKHRHWRTVRVKENKTDFWLNFPGGGRVYVRCRPTEVQNQASVISGGGALASSRTLRDWLVVPRDLTVMGLLDHRDDRAEIREAPKEGLFFSPLPPAKAAAKERTKGWAQAAGSAAAAAVSAGVLISQAFV